MHGQQNDKYTEMHGQQNDKYTEMHGQQNDKCTEMHGQQNVKIRQLGIEKKSVKIIPLCIVKFNIKKFYILPPPCVYMFCMDFRTNDNYFPKKHQMTDFHI